MGTPTLHIDIAIIGGGIAGLWTLDQLRNRGYSAVLFEQDALGSGQTIASQGMIHGGVKYALAGAWSGGSEAISAMPGTWRDCLAGRGKVDLRGSRVLSEDFFLWSGSALQSRLSAFCASRALRGRVEKVHRRDYPAPLRDRAFRGQVYRLVDLVVDVPSVVATLAERHRRVIFSIDWERARLERTGNRARLALPGCTLVPERLLLTSGAGNERLIANLGGSAPPMQRRPLQQVLVKHQYREPFYAHCAGATPNPRLTISSHRTRAGEPVWYLGGDLATENADETPARLIGRAREELRALLPWIDLGETRWATLRLDRAEPGQAGLRRPDSAFVGRVDSVDNVLAAWPTKLSLSPDLADKVERFLESDGIRPRHREELAPLGPMGRPGVAGTCWDTLFP